MKILQISDIHWTKRKRWNEVFPGMKSRFLVDIQEYIDAGNEIDYVFICGDIAYKGAADEYIRALEYIDKVCEIIGRTREEVFVVPGNHDLNRKATGYKTREILNAALSYATNNENYLDEILNSPKLGKDLFAAFECYNSFANEFFCQERLMNRCIKTEINEIGNSEELYYEEKLKKKVGDIDVMIRGVNTALNCDEWDWNVEYAAGHKQMLSRRAYILDKVEKQELRIIMGHHPIPFLTSDEEVKEYLDNHYHIQLFGHVHIQNIEGDNCVRVQSGAFDPPKDKKTNKYLPVYNIIEISQKDSTHVTVKGRSQIWDKNKFVENDNGCFEKEITIERNVNKWRKIKMEKEKIDTRSVKFKFMRLDDRTNYFDKISGVRFTPNVGTEYDNCIEFLSVLERMDKLAELNEMMK